MRMTVRSMGDKVPVVAPTAWVSEAAYLVGDVHLGDGSSVWPGAVVRGDFGAIRIGRNTVVEDNCVVHSGTLMTIGDNVLIGHSVVVHCGSIGPNCLIGSGATLLDDAEIGELCLVAAGSLVLGRTVVPDRSFVSGAPATIAPIPDKHLRMLEGLGSANVEMGYGMMARLYREAGL
jgi:carbonic anhydrase/acetyltransferase-like protein (isoleucine patch superfamily)